MSEKDAVRQTSMSAVSVADKKEIYGEEQDIGYSYHQEALQMDPQRREEIARIVKRKIDFCLLPAMCLIYLLSFLDKQTLNYANAYGLKTDLGLVGKDYSWIASITNIGYLVASYPSALALQKLPIGKFISGMLLSWGTILMFTALAKNFAGMMALRFLLGAFEACIGPAWILITSMFWKREEQPLRMSIWLGCNGISQMLGAGISWGIGKSDSTITPWQLIFLVIGSITFLFGAVAMFFFPSSPIDFCLFSEEERVVAVWRVASNQTGIKHNKVQKYQIKEALLEPRVWCLAIQQFSIGTINGGVANFMSALLKGFGYGPGQILLYQLPSGAFQLICTVSAGLFTSMVPNTTIFTICLVHLPSIAGIVGIATIDISHPLALTACCWLLSIVGAAVILNWSVVAANFAGHTKRMTVNGINFAFYASGNIVGPFLFDPAEAPRYMTAIKALCGLYASSCFFSAVIGLLMWMENRRRDAALANTNVEESVQREDGEIEGFSDHTDKENKAFRYRL